MYNVFIYFQREKGVCLSLKRTDISQLKPQLQMVLVDHYQIGYPYIREDMLLVLMTVPFTIELFTIH